jgi:hypothetical protein
VEHLVVSKVELTESPKNEPGSVPFSSSMIGWLKFLVWFFSLVHWLVAACKEFLIVKKRLKIESDSLTQKSKNQNYVIKNSVNRYCWSTSNGAELTSILRRKFGDDWFLLQNEKVVNCENLIAGRFIWLNFRGREGSIKKDIRVVYSDIREVKEVE